jgi:hypothetical protein
MVMLCLFSAALPACRERDEPRPRPASQSAFTATHDGSNLRIEHDGEPIFLLTHGYLARFRSTRANDHWIGTTRHPMNLSWLPNAFPDATATLDSVALRDHGFDVSVSGTKPVDGRGPLAFRTVVSAEARYGDVLTWRIESSLRHAEPGRPVGGWSEGRPVEYLDPWIEGIFWPQRDGHDEELYEYFVFGGANGVYHKSPKLHIFPSIRDASYETLVQPMGGGDAFGVLDVEEGGYLFRAQRLDAPGSVNICWWTWDPHFMIDAPPDAASVAYAMEIEPVAAGRAARILAEARPIEFTKDEDYQLPVFKRDGVNAFDVNISTADQWAWEPSSRACRVDDAVGADDQRSVTIKLDDPEQAAWYARALGVDYFDHAPLDGGWRVDALVRTRDLNGQARIGLVAHHGAETWLYEEPSADSAYSRPLSGTNDWTPVTLRFKAEGYQRYKLVLEQRGIGQSWFDNVTLTRDPDAPPIRPTVGHLDLRAVLADAGRHEFDLRDLRVARPAMRAGGGQIAMAWKDCWTGTPPMRLDAGSYRLIWSAHGTGCPFDPARLRVTLGAVFDHMVAIDSAAPKEWTLEFTVHEPVRAELILTFVNDGMCADGDQSIDKNAFLDSLAIERAESSD